MRYLAEAGKRIRNGGRLLDPFSGLSEFAAPISDRPRDPVLSWAEIWKGIKYLIAHVSGFKRWEAPHGENGPFNTRTGIPGIDLPASTNPNILNLTTWGILDWIGTGKRDLGQGWSKLKS